MTNSEGVDTVEISAISKSFNGNQVVDNLSFSVKPGEIFGLIGPNGAGKTTTIRMMMDIIKPDSGEINILGERLCEAVKNSIGYLPEERGLYKKLSVLQSLTYLASLKGIETRIARSKAEELLGRAEMLPHKGKRIEELSRGMGQIIQFLVTLIHDPQLLILDEPFANLDPVNTQLIKEIIFELRGQGKAIVLSTHRMNEVEELCDRILMVNEGRSVLYGGLAEIKSSYRNNAVLLEFEGELGEVDGVTGRKEHDNYVELFLDADTAPEKVLQQLVTRGIRISRFELATPSLHEIFLQVVEKER